MLDETIEMGEEKFAVGGSIHLGNWVSPKLLQPKRISTTGKLQNGQAKS
jgi:hypothetical protein